MNDGAGSDDGGADATLPPTTDGGGDAGAEADADSSDASADAIPDAPTDAIADSPADSPSDGGDDASDGGGDGGPVGDDGGPDASDGGGNPPDAGPCTNPWFPTYCANANGGYVCTDLYQDPNNCGACGHSCGGATCTNAHCDPLALIPGQSSPGDIRVRGDRLYWLDGTAQGYGAKSVVMTAFVDGGGVTELASGPEGAVQLALDSTYAYWTTCSQNVPGAVMKVPLAGGTPTTIATNLGCGIGIAVDANNVYWADSRKNTVSKAALNSGAVTTVATQQDGAKGVAVDANNLYWANEITDEIMKQPLAGGAPVKIGTGVGLLLDHIVVDAKNVYWSSLSGVVGATPIDASATVTLASGLSCPSLFTLDSGRLFFGTDLRCNQKAQASYVEMLDLATGATTVIASEGSRSSLVAIGGVAVDATNVYWSNDVIGAVGAIYRLAKP